MTKSVCCLYDRLKIDSSQFGDRWRAGQLRQRDWNWICEGLHPTRLTVLDSAFTSHCVSMKLKCSDQKRNTTASGQVLTIAWA